MLKQNRFTLLSIAVLLALLAAAMMPFAALAQDEIPPSPDAPVVDVPPADHPIGGETVVDAPVVDVPLADSPIGGDPVVDAPVVEDLTVPEIFDQLPEGTDLEVLDSSGETLPLSSIAAVDALTGGPATPAAATFCPTGGGACSTPTTIASAIADAYAAGATGGIITVRAGIFFENVIIQGSLFHGGVAPASLSLIGAGSGSTTIKGNVGTTSLKDFTFEGFTLSGTFETNSNTGTLNITDIAQNGYGKSVGFTINDQEGDVNITKISTTGNTAKGVDVTQRETSNHSITDSAFDGGYEGVSINALYAKTTNTITGNTFNGNTDNGVIIYADSDDDATLCDNTFTNRGTWDIFLSGHGTAKLDTTTNYVNTSFTVTDCSACPPVVPAAPTLLGGESDYNNPFVLYIPQIRSVPTLLEDSKLPGDLPEGSTLAVIANVALMLEGQQVGEAPNGVQASFTIPADMKDRAFNVLFWDGAKWVTITSLVTGDQVSFIVNQPGTYVLVAVP